MANKITATTLGQLDVMLRLGSAGDLSDGQLLDRVEGSTGDPAEAAFALLVERHGPMVLRVCREAIGNPHDAEDACQAVFLVLARKAGSVRRRESAAGWLYGVARKVSHRARRDLARRREHERRKGEQAARHPFEAAGPESWEELHEEVDRLPESYRSAVVLCHLEGLSHEEAANRLRCPLRTLQSRLLRARARLKDRLSRRGVAPGVMAWLEMGATSPPLSAKFAAESARIALSRSAGMVPAAVASLADGVLAMSLRSPLLMSLVALVGLGLAAEIARAVGAGRGGKPEAPPVAAAPPVAVAQAPAAPEEGIIPPGRVVARGVVVDEAGRAVAGASVVADAFTTRESRGVSAADGSFAVPVRDRQIEWTTLRASSPQGDRIGTFRYDLRLTREQAAAPSRVVLKRGRKVVARVLDANKGPVEGAAVVAIGQHRVVAEGITGPDGSSGLVVPVDVEVESVVALKSGLGLDYAETGASKAVDLVLDGARTAKIRAVDAEGKPLAGIGFHPWLIAKSGRRGSLNLGDYRALTVTTALDGVATFDWLPKATVGRLQFWPQRDGYAHRRVGLGEEPAGVVTVTMTRTETIRGRVVRPGGSAAPGIHVEARGTGRGMDDGTGHARSGADGTFEMSVPPGEAYIVFVDDEEWAAPSRLDVVVLPGKPVDGVDFKLSRGTLIRGKVTVGPGQRPAAGEYVRVDESAGHQAPAEVLEKGDRRWREVRRQLVASVDDEGRYSIRVGPGTYTLMGPPRTSDEKIILGAEPELVRDFRMPRPEKGPISGRVVEAATGRPMGGAKVDILAVNPVTVPVWTTTDAEGRFSVECLLDKLVICARAADGSLGAIVEVEPVDSEIVIPTSPTATASGILLDENGEPARNQRLYWGRRVTIVEKGTQSMTQFGSPVATDANGKFHLPALVVGQQYEIGVMRGNAIPLAGAVRPETPVHVDLGTLRIGQYRPWATAEDSSSFRKGQPEAGDPAPSIEASTLDGKPLKLEDFRGKFVLLDFWATWCGPCIAEIPQLEAVHDAFGKDPRFAILSLSVDEKVDEPRKFQELRKLPWTQAFLGQGIHSAIPGSFGVRAIPAFVLVGPDGKIVAKGMRGDDIKKGVARALGAKP